MLDKIERKPVRSLRALAAVLYVVLGGVAGTYFTSAYYSTEAVALGCAVYGEKSFAGRGIVWLSDPERKQNITRQGQEVFDRAVSAPAPARSDGIRLGAKKAKKNCAYSKEEGCCLGKDGVCAID